MTKPFVSLALLCSAVCGFASKFPLITAKSAIVMDAETGAVLYGLNEREARYPASTTKVMTALLLIEKCEPSEMIMAPHDVEQIEASSLHLAPFERLSAEDMLYALMLRSANDAAHAVACHIGGNDEGFAKLMNERAAQLGCTDTHFTNPHGLKDPLHKTSAYDLALITREAMKHERFRSAAGSKKKWLIRTGNPADQLLVSKNKFLDEPGAEGVKTGWTIPAGRCFVGSKSVDGWRLIVVVLGSEDWLQDTKALYDYAFSTFRREKALSKGDRVGDASVTRGSKELVRGVVRQDVTVIRGSSGPPNLQVTWNEVHAPVAAGEIIGRVVITDPVAGTSAEADVVAAEAVDVEVPMTKGALILAALLGIVIVGALAIVAGRRTRHG